VLLGIEGVEPHYELTVRRPAASDEVTVRCEPAPGADHDGLAQRVHAALRERTGLGFEVELVEAGTIPRSQGKAARVVDKR
jgi:phenylacetate-CoA ligase